MIISVGGFLIDVMQVFIIYPILFFLILIGFFAIAGFTWVCLTPGGHPVFSIPRSILSSRIKNTKVEDAGAL
jgi:hypothetical protein